MGQLKFINSFFKIIAVFFIGGFLFIQCHLLQNYETNRYGQIVPKYPNFTYKDKPFSIASNLDTLDVYILRYVYSENQLVYPSPDPNIKYLYSNLYYEYRCLKFYGNGRYCKFFIDKLDSKGDQKSLKVCDFNPNNYSAKKGYFFMYNSKGVIIENFYLGDGIGLYSRKNYSLTSSGDSLIYKSDRSNWIEIYEKVELPFETSNYDINW
ncbi:MAG: hypothetical protein H6Q25_1361 [Bacteroidetes bacterium]|nr:hypothetical protein [Bacteroidota bacterium]